MIRLAREIREFVRGTSPAAADSSRNSWSGGPAPRDPFSLVILRLAVVGEVNPVTGYLCDIHQIDDLLRQRVMPIIRAAVLEGQHVESCLSAMLDAARRACPAGAQVESMEIQATPYMKYGVRNEGDIMVSVTEQFEFSASHRLHCEEFSDEENRRLFGKCNNPHGHGHNYLLEVTISGAPQPETGTVAPRGELARLVNERVISRFDHKNLNVETVEFQRTNPSVENIARVIWSLLDGGLPTGRLTRVRVYETAKTWADCEGC